ncbi:DUF3152 domain-containing protein [Actinoalloteichus caeruleus]|uniref:DUF3152 domain-containing protein n=1 Tax=Actinoalloteichus cyanogriseus TaxID=2893586 RepID=UPI003AADACCB
MNPDAGGPGRPRPTSRGSDNRRPARRRPSEKRYQRDSRRTTGEPLAASWAPEAGARDEDQADTPRTVDGGEGSSSGRTRSRRAPSWRVYALPVLLVLTIIVAVDVARTPGEDAEHTAEEAPNSDATGGAGGTPGTEPAEPSVSFDANPSFDPDVISAELPNGGPFPTTGAGTYDIVPGRSEPVGEGDSLHRYTVEYEVGFDVPLDVEAYANTVEATLSDPRSWIGSEAISVQRVDTVEEADFRVILISQAHAKLKCGGGVDFEASCRRPEGVFLNAARWVRGGRAFEGAMAQYQAYLINHEVGHYFGHGHVPCDIDGGLAPVMMQQSWSTSNDELHELIEGTGQGGQAIPADGKVCKPNGWPHPTVE